MLQFSNFLAALRIFFLSFKDFTKVICFLAPSCAYIETKLDTVQLGGYGTCSLVAKHDKIPRIPRFIHFCGCFEHGGEGKKKCKFRQ